MFCIYPLVCGDRVLVENQKIILNVKNFQVSHEDDDKRFDQENVEILDDEYLEILDGQIMNERHVEVFDVVL